MKAEQKRLRIIAGPNGSGKSTFVGVLRQMVSVGVFVNADEIYETLLKNSYLSFDSFELMITQKQLLAFTKKHSLFTNNIKRSTLNEVKIFKNILVVPAKILNTYWAALVADLIRFELLKKGKNFTFETVMSHPDKLKFIDAANKLGYKTYLYYISTNSPELNVKRVKSRMIKGGHEVASKKIIERYYKSLQLAAEASLKCATSYMIDNSGNHFEIVSEKINRKEKIVTKQIPNWFKTYIQNKK